VITSQNENSLNSLSSSLYISIETVAHIQSAGCKAQKKSVIGAHNRCWKYLMGAISTHGEAKRSLEFIGGDKDRQLKHLWEGTRIGDILPWNEIEDEAEKLLERVRANWQASDDSHVSLAPLGLLVGYELSPLVPVLES
jgi:hypothetical protein